MISERENQKGRKGRNINDMQSGRNITLNIWDFAGQMAYYTTHQVCESFVGIFFNWMVVRISIYSILLS